MMLYYHGMAALCEDLCMSKKCYNFAGGIGVPCERYRCRCGVIQVGVNKLNVLVYEGIADDVHKTFAACA